MKVNDEGNNAISRVKDPAFAALRHRSTERAASRGRGAGTERAASRG